MSDPAQSSGQASGPRPRNTRLRRGISIIPAAFTVANLSCGYYAVLATLHGTAAGFNDASRGIGLAILFDMLDGRIARATGTNTEFGKQFDSLADVVSFGIAPAFLAFTWGVRAFISNQPGLERNVYWFGLLVTATFLICCAWRLARFNIQGMGAGQESKYFIGMPTPAGAGMIAASVHALKEPVQDWRFAVCWLVIVGGLAALMTSTIRYYGFKDINLHLRRPSLMVVLMGLLVWSIVAFSEQVLFLIAGTYVLSGIALHVVRMLRRPKPAA